MDSNHGLTAFETAASSAGLIELEDRTGIEPVNKRFANASLAIRPTIYLVKRVGLEPTKPNLQSGFIA